MMRYRHHSNQGSASATSCHRHPSRFGYLFFVLLLASWLPQRGAAAGINPLEIPSAPVPTTVPFFEGRINNANVDGLVIHFNNPTIEFTWSHATAPAGIQKYHVLLNHPGVQWVTGVNVNYPGTSATINASNLIDGETYRIHIRAQDNNGVWGPFIAGGDFTVQLGPDNTPPTTVPNFSGMINGNVINGGTINTTNPVINFFWDHAEDASGIDYYHVLLNHPGVQWVTGTNVNYPGTSATINASNLIDGETYRIHIRARDNSGNWGTFVAGGDFTVDLGADVTPPSDVPNFQGQINGQNVNGLTISTTSPTIDYSWNHATDPSGIEEYVIAMNRIGGGPVWLDTVDFPATSVSIPYSGLVDGDSYHIGIQAKDNAGNYGNFVGGGDFNVDLGGGPDNTPPSTVPNFAATINGQPLNGQVVTVSNPSISFTWGLATDVGSGVDYYHVLLNRPGVGWVQGDDVNHPQTSHTMTTSGLVDGASYRVHIRARDNAGNFGQFVAGGDFTVDLGGTGCGNCWSNPTVWPSGQVPGPGDNVTIPAGQTIVLDTDVDVNRILVNGTLYAKRDEDLNITTKSILVDGNGAVLDFGTVGDRYPSRMVVTLTGSNPNDSIAGMGAKFVGARNGGVIQMHGEPLISWSQLGASADPGDNQIVMKEGVNWRVGDKILIVSTTIDHEEAEERTITAINGSTITLNAGLSHPHAGAIENYSDGTQSWSADLRAEVGLLTHNITIQGDAVSAQDSFGGHMMVHYGAAAYVDGVELYRMGQRSRLGRYPFHWHMVAETGQGQYLKNSSIHNSYNRAVTIHGTESTLVENNFMYKHYGHGVFLEDGSERFNVIRGNVALWTVRPKPGEELTPSDNERFEIQNLTPATYWITNPSNTFEDNVAAGTDGTGYWFAFPESPMGLSATHPRFIGMEPHTLPLISFKRNKAHSCGNGFDIFDRLTPGHSIVPNDGWANSDLHYMDDCQWYANHLALYTGSGRSDPTDNLIFRNNTFVENRTTTMFASYSIVDQSVIVAHSGENLIAGSRRLMRIYDGPGQIRDSYFVGWDANDASLLFWLGGANKHVNHRLVNNTKDHSGPLRISLPDFDLPPAYSDANAWTHPRVWSHVIRDLTGGITGVANSSIVGSHPFQLVGDETQPSNWINTYLSNHHFVLARVTYIVARPNIPDVTVTRTKAGTPTESVYYIHGYREHHQLPFIVNEGFMYSYDYEEFSPSRLAQMHMDDAFVGDTYLARYVDFGKLPGLNVTVFSGAGQTLTQHFSLASLQNATTSGYYIEPNGDLYVKPVATTRDQAFDIRWNTTTMQAAKVDTDGDEMADGLEVINGRHPFDASDLAADFDNAGEFEGWDQFVNISGQSVSAGMLSGTGNGDAQIINNDYNFDSDAVSQIQIRFRSSASTSVQLYFATDTQGGFSGSRVLNASYNSPNSWQTLTFNVGNHSGWNGLITDLRLDPTTGSNASFDINWIHSTGGSMSNGNDPKEEGGKGKKWAGFVDAAAQVAVWPNPMTDLLNIQWDKSGQFEQVRLLDTHGRLLRKQDLRPGADRVVFSLGDLDLSEGMYVVELIGDSGVHRVKVLKMNRM